MTIIAEEPFDSWPKYLVYVSPTKVDSLYGQLGDSFVKRISKKLTIDLKIVKAEFGDAIPREQTVYARLRVVLQALYDREQVGSVNEPGQYFRSLDANALGPLGSRYQHRLVRRGSRQHSGWPRRFNGPRSRSGGAGLGAHPTTTSFPLLLAALQLSLGDEGKERTPIDGKENQNVETGGVHK